MSNDNTIDTSSGNLVLSAATGSTVEITKNTSVTGSVTANSFTSNNSSVQISKNTSVSGTVSATSFAGNGTIPVGGIIMWSGTIANIPSGWALCNGLNGTPNLRDKFIVGASVDVAGISSTTVTGANTKTGGSPDAVVVNHTHAGNTTTTGTHVHSVTVRFNQNQIVVGTGAQEASDLDGTGDTQTINTGSGEGGHSHNVSVTNPPGGVSGENQNLPPYFALAFIMRTA